ncbi:MAG: pentapeptide repeat-containing protein, partial [Hyphomicrobiaceae bacterium]|nr:pentapeptide repeat-containing protein [Hyphomicrobiaceae bacterium]
MKMRLQRAARAIAALVLTLTLGLATRAVAEETEPVSPDADFTVREITSALFKAKPGERLDYSNHDLTYLDLAGLNLKGATLARSDLYGTDFTGANLKGTDLSHTRLDRSVLIRADLSGANLTGATIFRPTVYSDLTIDLADAPRFTGADLTGVRVMAD